MKQLFFFLLITISNNSNAQFWRTVDLNLRLISPITSEESKLDFATPGEFLSSFYIKNQGPDTIFPNDTLIFFESKFFYYTDERTVVKKEFGDTLIPGDSILFEHFVKSKIWENYEYARIRFQIFSSAHSSRKTIFTEVGNIGLDNISQMFINLRKNTSIEDLNFNTNYTIFPNPFHESITIKTLNNIAFEWELIDLTGKVLISKSSKVDDPIIELNLKNYNQSIFFLKIIESNGTILTHKILKQ